MEACFLHKARRENSHSCLPRLLTMRDLCREIPRECKQGLLFSSSHEANNVPLTQTFPHLLIESPARVNSFQKTPSTILAMLALPFPEFLLFHSTQHKCGIFLDVFYLCIHLASGTKLSNPSLGLYYLPIY